MAIYGSSPTVCLVVCGAILLLAAPAIALFYGSAGRRGTVAALLSRWLLAIPVLGLQWILFGYSLAFGPTRLGLLGRLSLARMTDLGDASGAAFFFGACRMGFAVTAPALIASALGARMRLGAYLAFVVAWATFVYDPIAHWLWASGGWLANLGALDFSGGIVLHFVVGIAAAVCAAFVGARSLAPGSSGLRPGERHRKRERGRGGEGDAEHPGMERSGVHDRLRFTSPLAVLATMAFLWIGWFAFHAGSVLASASTALRPAAGGLLALSFWTTQLGAAGGGMGWLVVEWSQRGRVAPIGVASGVLAGLVAVTPAAGCVAPSAAIAIGFIAGSITYGTQFGVVAGLVAGLLGITAGAGHVEPLVAVAIVCVAGAICHAAVLLKGRFGFGDAPDPFSVHGIGGLVGALLTGVFAQRALSGWGADGALFGHLGQLAIQMIACATTGVYTAAVTIGILRAIDVTIGLRAVESSREAASETHDADDAVTEKPAPARALEQSSSAR